MHAKSKAKYVMRGLSYLFGIAFMSAGFAFTIKANLGVQPWTAFHLGLSGVTGLSVGRVAQIVGFVVLVVAGLLLREFPRWGAFGNMLLVGFFLDEFLSSGWLPNPNQWYWQLATLILGVAAAGVGGACYIRAGFGAGPRDGLMLALRNLTGRSIASVRASIELSVLVAGCALGGPVGLGTVVGALGTGIALQQSMRLLDWLETRFNRRGSRCPAAPC